MTLHGAPIGPDIELPSDVQVFSHVPHLRELLANGGWPGVVYAQVCVHNVKAAADRTQKPAHLRPISGSTYYSIVGPQGRADMALVGCQKPIPGASPDAGARLFFTDGEVGELTGHKVEYPIWFKGEPHGQVESTPRAGAGQGQGQESPRRVQGRKPAQRLQDRADREEQEASRRDRARRAAASERMKALWAKRKANAHQEKGTEPAA